MSIELIKQLREITGVGISDAKKFLDESGGNLDAAIEVARKHGQKVAAKKQDRVAGQGMIDSYIHGNGKIGVLLQLNCETDFVARNESFRELAHELCIHIAAMNPVYIKRDDISADVIAKEKEIETEVLKQEGKPEAMIEKILEGKLNKFYADNCLLEQVFVKDDSKKVLSLIEEYTLKLGEKIEIVRFIRYTM
jgi:elongation factor Ts